MNKLIILLIAIIYSINVNAQVTDYGMTSTAHKEFVGQIVFSKSPIKFKNENKSDFTADYNYPEETAYFMAYFPKSIGNRCFEEHGFMPGIYETKITFTFFVEDKQVAQTEMGLTNDQLQKWTGWSDPNKPIGLEEGMMPQYCFIFKDDVRPHLKKGVNNVKMAVGYIVRKDGKEYTNEKTFTEGILKLTLEKDFQIVLKAAPKAVMNNPALENKIKDALVFRWGKTSDIKKVILTESNWKVENNYAGIPVHKILTVYAITSPKDGE